MPSRRRPHPARGGLAPLELVLNLPIMLMVMALIVIIGHAGVWKARAHTNARHAVWRTFYYRSGSGDPKPRGWTNRYARMGRRDAEPSLLQQDPYPQGHPVFSVVRGQPYSEPATGRSIPVRRHKFEMPEGLLEGFADYDGPWPFLQPMKPGRYRMHRRHPVLDDRWQFTQQGLGSNRRRRLLWLYPVDLRPQIPNRVQRYIDAAIAVIMNPLRPDLLPLDGDPDLNEIYGNRGPDYHRQRFTLDSRYPGSQRLQRKVHPRIPSIRLCEIVCTFDPAELRSEVVDQMIEEVRGTDEHPRDWRTNWGRPGVMTDDYLRNYRARKQRYENELNSIAQQIADLRQQLSQLPPGDPRRQQIQQQIQQLQQRQQWLQGQIPILDQWISELEKFRDQELTP